MKKILLTLALALTTLAFTAGAGSAAEDASKWSDSQKFSYILGTQLGQLSKLNNLKVDIDILDKGLKESDPDSKKAMTNEEMQVFMIALQQKAKEKQMAAIKEVGDTNGKTGSDFLAENKGKNGVKTTDSGLQYKVIKSANGKKPTALDKVEVHYKGTFIDGKEFDSSYKRGTPAKFPLAGVIKGWTEGLQLMSIGSTYEFYIPAELAYGDRAPANIGPNQTLIFQVELLDVL
ncbi:MAG: FKBP-type peptidyl-prolyl cis-trans isomerase [Thermodesulfobacteriota bacterium]